MIEPKDITKQLRDFCLASELCKLLLRQYQDNFLHFEP